MLPYCLKKGHDRFRHSHIILPFVDTKAMPLEEIRVVQQV
jgi:hypothetical protein